MKILIIGGTRFIGKAVTNAAILRGHQVTLFNRGQSESGFTAPKITADVENLLDFKEKILRENFDVVVHCIAYTEKHAEDIANIFHGTNTHVIVLSSGDCYESFQGLNRKVDKAELPVTEDSQLSSTKYYWSDSQTKGPLAATYDKNLMTDILMRDFDSQDLKTTVFRLSFIYGPGDYNYQGRHGAVIRRIIDKRKNLIFSDREQCQVYTYGYVENVAAAIVHSFNLSQTFGQIYNLGEIKSRSRRRWAEAFARATGWEFVIHVLPEELLRKDKSYRNAPPLHFLMDSSLFCRETNFAYPVSLEDAVSRTFEYAKQHPEILGPPPDYLAEDRLLESYYIKMDQIHSELNTETGSASHFKV